METSGEQEDMPELTALKVQVGQRLLQLRGSRKQEEIAQQTNLDQSTISRLERGEGRFTLAQLQALARCYGLTVRELLPPYPDDT